MNLLCDKICFCTSEKANGLREGERQRDFKKEIKECC